MRRKILPIDAYASGAIADLQIVYNAGLGSYEDAEYRRRFWFSQASNLIIYDFINDIFWPEPDLMNWITNNSGESWYMSAGGTFIVVEIVNQSACDDFLHKFFPETNTPNIPAGEYRDVCNGRKTFWVRPKSRLVQIFGSLIYCTDDLYEWDRLDGVSKRASVTGDFLIVSMPEGQLATRFREEILMHIHFRSNWRIKIKQFYDGTLRLFYKYFGLGNYFFSRWVRNNFVSVFIKICYEIESEINSLVDVEEILKKPIVGSHSTIIEIRKLKLSRQLKFVSNELPYFSFTVSVWNQHDAVDYDISAVGIRGAYIPLCLRYTETVRTIHLTSFYGEKMTEETSTFVNILEKDYSFIVYRHGF